MTTRARSYLDHNASSPLRPEARAALLDAVDAGGNPSSVHGEGRKARALIEDARRRIAGALGVPAGSVTFTSGASEAASTVLSPTIRAAGSAATRRRLIVSATEHVCVRSGGRFAAEDVAIVPVERDGLVDEAALESLLASEPSGACMVSIQAANNETGVVQPLGRLRAIADRHGALLVVDAVQAVGRLADTSPLRLADVLLLSSHKLGGPVGAGAIIRPGAAFEPAPLIAGGGQERGLRGGTENAPAIAGFAVALEAAIVSATFEADRLARLRTRLEDGLRAIEPATVLFGETVERLPNTTLFAVPGANAETALMALDLAGVAVSSGSACSSGKVGQSHVLAAMHVPADLARAAIRISSGWNTADDDISRLLDAWASHRAALARRRRQAA